MSSRHVAALFGGFSVVVLAFAWLSFGIDNSSKSPARSGEAFWVPFRAEFRILEANSVVAWGTYARSIDGSDRTNTYANDPRHAGIAMRNIGAQKFYRFKDGRGWTQQPMQIPLGGWKPRSYPPSDKTEIVAGLLLHTYRKDDDYFLRAPALSNFAVTRRTGGGSRLEEYFSIKFGDVAMSEFHPPAGVSVEWNPQPGGILVFSPK